MTRRNDSVAVVESFWRDVWVARNPDAVDRYVSDDFVITNAGKDIVGRAAFKSWVAAFLKTVDDFTFDVIESFQNEDGSRVASRWRVRGRNNGIFGTLADRRALELTGTAVWEVGEDGKLRHNWVERSGLEAYLALTTR